MKEMVEVLKEKGNVAELVVYPGEGHGWRQSATVRESLERELVFFSRVLGLELPMT